MGEILALAPDRRTDHVRVLSDLSGLVVGALVDDPDARKEGDAFSDALRRYREEGAPDIGSWRSVTTGLATEVRTAQVLRHLTRDLLKGLSIAAGLASADTDTEVAAESPPQNVRPITAEARDVPALELASDGTWKPSGSSLAAQDEVDARTLRRNVPSARSRYPQLARDERMVLPPAPPRFTQITAPPAPVPVPEVFVASAAPAAPPIAEQPAAAEATLIAQPIDERDAPVAPASVDQAPQVERASVIKAVAGGVELIAGPFARFQQLAAFVKALRALPGVHDVTTRQFVRGMVHLRVRHAHSMALADRLLELSEFDPSIVSSAQDRIELSVKIEE